MNYKDFTLLSDQDGLCLIPLSDIVWRLLDQGFDADTVLVELGYAQFDESGGVEILDPTQVIAVPLPPEHWCQLSENSDKRPRLTDAGEALLQSRVAEMILPPMPDDWNPPGLSAFLNQNRFKEEWNRSIDEDTWQKRYWKGKGQVFPVWVHRHPNFPDQNEKPTKRFDLRSVDEFRQTEWRQLHEQKIAAQIWLDEISPFLDAAIANSQLT